MFSVRTPLTSACCVAVLALGTAGCGSGDRDASAPAPTVTVTATPSASASASSTPAQAELTTATAYARAINKQVGSVTKVTTLTETNDPNNLIGRPNGYVSAAVITDKQGDSSDPEPGVAYGATVEMFGTKAEASRRSAYIQGLLKDSPMLGTEYDYTQGKVLLRVSGELRPSVAMKYQAAFEDAAG
jgi:hypothetical protein